MNENFIIGQKVDEAHNVSENEFLKLIDDFFSLIKDMLFLNVTDKVSEYYHQFEKILQNKNLNW